MADGSSFAADADTVAADISSYTSHTTASVGTCWYYGRCCFAAPGAAISVVIMIITAAVAAAADLVQHTTATTATATTTTTTATAATAAVPTATVDLLLPVLLECPEGEDKKSDQNGVRADLFKH